MKRTIVAAAALGFASAGVFVVPANAEGGLDQSSNGGYKVSVHVTVSGADAGKVGKAGGSSLRVEPSCWWKLYNPEINGNDATTPEGFKKYYDESIPMLSGHAAAGRLAMPSHDEVERVTKAAAAGAKYRWYMVECKRGVNPVDAGYTKLGGNYMGLRIGVSFAAFIEGQEPEPYVAPKDLADALWAAAEQGLGDPTMDRNPKVAANGGAAVVNLPTWFWVTNPAASLADDGKIELTATAGNTTVNLTATSSGVTLTSPVGFKVCSVEQAKQAYATGKSNDSACTIAFERPNPGWPVTASISWGGAWTGNDGTGEALPEVYHSSTFNVPVVEVQVPNR